MKLTQLKKNIGHQLRLRPKPIVLESNGAQSPTDDPWLLEAILPGPDRLRLLNSITDKVVELRPDNVREYQSPDFLVLKCQLTLTQTGFLIEPLVSAFTLPRPLPIARYQGQRLKVTNEYVPLRPEVCDGCTAAVEFRPIVKVKMPGETGLPWTEEQFCPPCAMRRDVTVQVPPGMDEDALYAESNPSFQSHVGRLLKSVVLSSLSQDVEVRARNVSHVGAAIDAKALSLMLFDAQGQKRQIDINLSELYQSNVRSEDELIEHAKRLILQVL